MAKKYEVGPGGTAANSPFLLSLKGPADGDRPVLRESGGAVFVAKRGPGAGNER